MKMVFIYGPPAAGKLTVASELAKLTGFKICHNHLTFDCARSLFDVGDALFKLSNNIRFDMFEAAAQHDISLIFTMCYVPKLDDGFVRKALRKVRKYNAKAYFVYLHCDRKELMKRVKRESRKRFEKIKTCKTLKECISKYEFGKIPFVDNLDLDNTNISPKKAAKKIAERFGL